MRTPVNRRGRLCELDACRGVSQKPSSTEGHMDHRMSWDEQLSGEAGQRAMVLGALISSWINEMAETLNMLPEMPSEGVDREDGKQKRLNAEMLQRLDRQFLGAL